MAWAETCSVKAKARFCVAYEAGEASMSELCRRFGVSRKAGYAALARWRLQGPAGLAERSHALIAARARARSARAIIGLRRFSRRGVRRGEAVAGAQRPDGVAGGGTIGDLLSRVGLSARRKRRRHVPHARRYALPRANDVWADF
jgi:transposase